MLRQTPIGLVLAFLVALPVAAQDFQRGLAAAKRGDYAIALKEWRLLAAKGHAKAQYALGFIYDNGLGVSQDYAEAVRWYRKAATQGYVAAINNLGVMYHLGQDVSRNYGEAVKWYRIAAKQGYANAQFNLGIMYRLGLSVPQDYDEAAKWYRKAAEQGHSEAQNHLGAKYVKGRGGITKAPARELSSDNSTAKATLSPAEVAAPRSPPAPASSGYLVQLSAFKSKARAVKEAERLSRVHKAALGSLKIAVVRADLAKRGTFYRLRAKPLTDRAAADALCRKFSARNQGCIVIKP